MMIKAMCDGRAVVMWRVNSPALEMRKSRNNESFSHKEALSVTHTFFLLEILAGFGACSHWSNLFFFQI